MRTKEPCIAIFGLDVGRSYSASYESKAACRESVRTWKDGVKGLRWVRIVDKNGEVEMVKCPAAH